MSETPACRILAISGSLQSHSGNRALLEVARSCAGNDAEVAIFGELHALPAFNPDVKDSQAPASVVALRQALAACDAVLLASPEYGFSLPGALKNAIDWLIGSGELEGKIVGVTAAVKVQGRGQRGLDALIEPLRAVSARIVGGTPITQGHAFEREVTDLVQAIVREERHASVPADHGLGTPRPSALVAEWVERVNQRDVDALVLLYSEQASVQPLAEAPAVGRVALRELYMGRFAQAAPLLVVKSLIEDRTSAVLEWTDASTRAGCVCFSVERWQIASQREYGQTRQSAGPATG